MSATPETETVLVVDDEELVAAVCVEILAESGFDAVRASSGREALDVLETRDVAVLLTDVRMPGMSGLELLATVRSRWPDIAAVVMSAVPTPALVTEAQELGATAFLTKPAALADLVAAVRAALSSSSGKDALRRS